MAVKFIPHPPAVKMLDRPLFQRIGMAMKSARTIISGIDPSTQFSPLQPLTPFAPQIIGRQFDFPVGYNLNYIPRGYQTGLTPFAELRNLARNCEILRLGIETCIDQICTFDWQFAPKEDSKISPDDPRIAEVTDFFKSPDKINTFSQWIGAIVEELLVTDSVSIYRPKTRKGAPYAFELMDGACYSHDTEVLTRGGWKRFDKIDMASDEFATRNIGTKRMEWQKATYFHEVDYVGQMCHFHSRAVDILVSPNHRMLIDRLPRALGGSRHRQRDEAVVKASELMNITSPQAIPMTSIWKGIPIVDKTFQMAVETAQSYRALIKMNGDDYCAFMGMWLAEGCVTREKTVLITQCEKSRGYKPYAELMDRIGLNYWRNGNNFVVCSRSLVQYLRQFGHARKKFVPTEIREATPEQLELFWRYYWLGDGSAERDRIFTSSPIMADHLVEIAQKRGLSASISIRKAVNKMIAGRAILAENCADHFVVSVRETETMIFQKSYQQYAGKIRCVSVPNEFLYVRRNGKPSWCGNTIFPLLDNDGRRPTAPDPAYQQILKGTPKTDYDTTELLYMPKKRRVYTPYGFPAVEQIIMTARKAINRDVYQLMYFTAGSVPDAYAEMPEGMTPDDIKSFEERFNNMLTGNAAQRRQVPFLPAGAKINQLKEPILTDAFDEWMARLVMFSLSLPPNAFVKQQNRATAESEKDRALQEGQAPRLQFIKGILDTLIADFGPEYSQNIEAIPKDNANQDPTITANNSKTYVAAGIKTINECRADIGLDPMEGGDQLMALTPTGYVPLDSFEQTQAMQQDQMKATADAKANAQNNQQAGAPNQSAPHEDVAGKSAYSRLGKAVRHPADPFVSTTLRKERQT